MAKRLISYWWEQPFVTVIGHFGRTARLDPNAWHCTYAYPIDEYPFVWLDLWPIGHATLLKATLCSRDLAALPAIVRDMCPYCWSEPSNPLDTYKNPRFNIYRGQGHELVIPCIYWDFNNPDPPPGFTWY